MTKILTNSYTATTGFSSSMQQIARGLVRVIVAWMLGGQENQLPGRLRYDIGLDDLNPDTMRGGRGTHQNAESVNAMMRSRSF